MRARAAHPRLGYLLVVSAAIIFGVNGGVSRVPIHAGLAVETYTTVRVTGGFLAFALLCLVLDRGAFRMPRGRTALDLVVLGVLGVAFLQWTYNIAVVRLPLGVALLLEYLAPVLIVGWVWARHGRRPSRLTAAGVGAAVLGLVLVLDVASGARLDVVGVLWGLLAAVGLVVFFLVAADEEEALPPISFAGGGLAVGALGLLAVAALGWLPMAASTDPVDLAGWSAPWWVAVAELAIVAGAVAYASGIAAARLLGGTIASFVGLSEVLFAIVFAWLVVGQAMSPVQLLGGLAVLAGVVMVKLGEGEVAGAALPVADVDAAIVAGGDEPGETELAEPERVH